MSASRHRRSAGRSSPRCAPRTKRCERRERCRRTRSRPRPRSRAGWWRAFLSALCIVIATILVPVSIVSAWARVQLVDEDAFVATLAPLVDDPAVQAMIIDESMEAINAQVDFQQITSNVFDGVAALGLPPRAADALQLLEAPAANGLREPRDDDRDARGRIRRLLRGVGDRDACRPSRPRGRCDLRRRRARRPHRRGGRHPARRRRRARQAEPRRSRPRRRRADPDRRPGRHHRRGRQPGDDPHGLRARDHARVLAAGHHARPVRSRHPDRPPSQHRRPRDRHRLRDRRRHAGRDARHRRGRDGRRPPARSASRPTR